MGFRQRLLQIVQSRGLTEQEQIDLGVCTVLKKIQRILERIIAGFPAEVQERASYLFQNIQEKLSPDPKGPADANGSASSSGSSSSRAAGGNLPGPARAPVVFPGDADMD